MSFEPTGLSGNTEWVRVTRAAAVWPGHRLAGVGRLRHKGKSHREQFGGVVCALPPAPGEHPPGEGQGGALVQEPVAGGTKREGRREDAGGQGPSDPLVPGQGPLPLSDRAGSRPPTQ